MPTIVRTFEEAGQKLVLRDLGEHYELLLGQVPILSSKALGTERAFGELTASLATGPAPLVIVGGLGFGATLKGVLAVAPKEARILVVEKLATVIQLMQTDLAHLAPEALSDRRVQLVHADVGEVLASERGAMTILLDVDNGPGWASFRSNAALYAPEGLRRAKEALAVGGSLAIWSGYPADTFVGNLRRAGLTPSVIPLKERGRVQARAYVGRLEP